MDKITEERARACYIVHRGACEQWTHGEPAEVWRIFLHPNRVEMAYRLKGDSNNEKSYYNN